MRVTLISLHPEIFSVGFRTLSACLKRDGHEVNLIFLPGGDFYKPKEQRYLGDYTPEILDNIVDLCRGSGLIGISLLTNYFLRAKVLTKALQEKLDIPVLWGGPHPTAQPEECLQYADMVCLGEGEETLLELADRTSTGQEYDRIPNLWLCRENDIVRNNVRPLSRDLDSLPIPDCDLIGQNILDNGGIRTVDSNLLRKHSLFQSVTKSGVVYLVLSSRGCPHKCAYCMESGRVRRRSIENVCDELEHAIEKIPDIKAINFADENFSAMKISELQKYLETYVNRIGLPFSCSVSSVFADDQRMDMLLHAGVYRISMGIQSGSERILKMYKRNIPIKKTMQAVKKLESVRHLMREPRQVSYHFIVDNPYENAEDKLDTLKLILKLPRRGSVHTFSLVPFPGTAIYDMMRRDGLIVDEYKQIWTKDFLDLQPSFTKYWFYLYYGGVPTKILFVLLRPGLVRIMDCGRPRWLLRIIYLGLEQGYRFLGTAKRFLARSVVPVKLPK